MIDLNKRKQAEVKRFLAWLEGRVITPKNGAGGIDSLTGKTILQNYLGDYQKDLRMHLGRFLLPAAPESSPLPRHAGRRAG